MYNAIAANKRNTVFIMLVFIVLIAVLGYFASLYYNQPLITPYVIAGAAIYALIQYFMAAKLAVAMTGAKEIQ